MTHDDARRRRQWNREFPIEQRARCSSRPHFIEDIVHPLVRQRIAAFLKAAEATGVPLAVVDIPLLFEGGYDYGLDKVAVTVCDEAIQRRRALARPGMTVEKLETILARQLPQAEKRKRADYIFDTSGSLEATEAEVKALVDEIGSGG